MIRRSKTDSGNRHHRSILQAIARRAMIERGLVPDFSSGAGDKLKDLERDAKNRAKDNIEDFMVSANGIAARYLVSKGFPSLRRVVRTPKRWDRIVELAAERSFPLPKMPDARALEQFLSAAKAADPLRFPDLSLSIVKLLGAGEYVVEGKLDSVYASSLYAPMCSADIPTSRRVKMKHATEITTLFLDVGGVLLTDGWDRHARKRAAANFKLKLGELEDRHHLTFDTYEEGKLTLEEYLNRVIFYRKRPFTRAQFRRFMFAQSQPHPEMIDLIVQLKARNALKIVVVSNEARELNAYRIRKFKLNRFVDFFVSSCFVHLRKPDADIFRLALDIAQVPVKEILYIENTPMFVQIAEGLGIRSIHHTNYISTRAKLAAFGLLKEDRHG